MKKLAALVPPPRAHIIICHGIFTPHSKSRSKIVLREQKREKSLTNGNLKQRERMSWAKLLNRVFRIDLAKCHFCKGEIKIIAAVIENKANDNMPFE